MTYDTTFSNTAPLRGTEETPMSQEKLVNTLVTIVIGLALLPVVRGFVADAIEGSSASEEVLLGLITIFWVIALVIIVVKMTKSGK